MEPPDDPEMEFFSRFPDPGHPDRFVKKQVHTGRTFRESWPIVNITYWSGTPSGQGQSKVEDANKSDFVEMWAG